MAKIKWGVIGSCGIAKRRTIPEGLAKADNADLVVVYDIDGKANAELAGQFTARAAGSVDELLAEDIDAVYVATPINVHCEQVLACAEAGKHVLCEKPFGMNVAEAQKMVKSCSDAGVVLGAGYMMRFHSQHQAALKMVNDGKLGRLVYGRAQLSCWYPPIKGAWRQDPATGAGGSLIDMGSHCIDLLEMYFGRVKKLSCFIGNLVHNYKSEDGAVMSLFFENGGLATVDTFFCIPDASSKNALELYGSAGSILARGTIGQGQAGEMVAFLEGGSAGYDAQQRRGEGGATTIAPRPVNMYRAEVEEFGRAVSENRPPSNSAELGLHSQKMIAACYESAKTGRAVEVH